MVLENMLRSNVKRSGDDCIGVNYDAFAKKKSCIDALKCVTENDPEIRKALNGFLIARRPT